jgi:hypothetical protein
MSRNRTLVIAVVFVALALAVLQPRASSGTRDLPKLAEIVFELEGCRLLSLSTHHTSVIPEGEVTPATGAAWSVRTIFEEKVEGETFAGKFLDFGAAGHTKVLYRFTSDQPMRFNLRTDSKLSGSVLLKVRLSHESETRELAYDLGKKDINAFLPLRR